MHGTLIQKQRSHHVYLVNLQYKAPHEKRAKNLPQNTDRIPLLYIQILVCFDSTLHTCVVFSPVETKFTQLLEIKPWICITA